jgi:hypothetical protein
MRKGIDTMRTLLVISAIILASGNAVRFMTFLEAVIKDKKRKPWGWSVWSALETLAMAELFNYFSLGG